MPPHLPKAFDAARSGQSQRSGRERDIIWDRPVFRAPLLPNPRIIFDPLPFTAQRLTAFRRHAH